MRLNIKLPLLMIAMAMLLSIPMAVVLWQFQQETAMNQFEDSSSVISSAITAAVEHHMLLNHPENITRGMELVTQEAAINRVTLYAADQSVVAEVGDAGTSDRWDPSQMSRVLGEGHELTEVFSVNGRRELHTLTPIRNSPECFGCHDSSIAILGAMDTGLDMSEVDNQLRNQNMWMAILAVGTLLILGIGLSVLVQRAVLGRLRRLSTLAKEFSHGDYSSRSGDLGGDEVGVLARAFDEMAESIEQRTSEANEYREKLEELNEELNERIEAKTKQLADHGEISRAVSHSLDLHTILNDVVANLARIFGCIGVAVYLVDDLGDRLGLAAHWGFQDGTYDAPESIDTDSEAVKTAMASGEPVTVDECPHIVPNGATTAPVPAGESCIAVALRSKEKSLGMLVLFGTPPLSHTPERLQTLKAMSHEIGIGVDHAMTAERLQQASTKIHDLLNKAIESGFGARFENPYLVKCWEEKECTFKDCPAYEAENLRCWQLAGTRFAGGPCSNCGQLTYRDCSVYKKSCARDEITAIGENFNNMMFLLSRKEQELIHDNTGLATLVRCAQILTSGASLQNKIRQVMNELSEILPQTAGLLLMRRQEGDRFLVKAGYGCDSEAACNVELRPDEWIVGFVAQSGTAVALKSADEIANLGKSLDPENRELLRQAGSSLVQPANIVCAPLLVGSKLIGVLSVFDLGRIHESDTSLAQSLADQIAITIENDRLYKELEHREQIRGELLRKLITTQEEERKRIARELHDEAGQSITAMMMSTSVGSASVPEERNADKARLAETNELAKAVLSKIRKVISDLRPAVLDDLGLVPAIRAYAKQNAEDFGIETELELESLKKRLPSEIEISVFRVVQEALTNVVRHSGATVVKIRLGITDNVLNLTIQDNGKGFDTTSALAANGSDRRWGLLGMLERVALLSGTLNIASAEGAGTTIDVRIPLRNGNNEQEDTHPDHR